MLKKLILVIGSVMIIGAGLWYVLITPQAERRLSDDWVWSYDISGSYVVFDEGTDESIFDTPISDDDQYSSQYELTISDEDRSAESVVVEVYYADVDPVTEEVTFSYTDRLTVNPQTGKFVDAELADQYFVFPRNVEQKSYELYDSYYGNMHFKFVKEETIAGLKVYKFENPMKLLDETQYYIENEYIEADSGVGIACRDAIVYYWVEPITGEVLKLEENCPREYTIDLATQENIAPFGRWYYISSGDDLQRRSDEIKTQLNDYRLRTLYAPLGLLVIGLILSIGGFFSMRKSD